MKLLLLSVERTIFPIGLQHHAHLFNLSMKFTISVLFALFCTLAHSQNKFTGFHSVFISIDSKTEHFPWFFERAEWEETMKLLHEIGVTHIILSNSVTEQDAHYPTKIPGLNVVSDTTVRDVLESAMKYKINVFLGIALRNAWFFNGECMNPAFLKVLVADMSSISRELDQLYGHYPNLKGFYNTAEVWSECCNGPCNSTMATMIGEQFIEPLGKVVNSLSKDFVYSIAPFYQNSTTPADQVAFWSSVLHATPSVEVIMFQDGVGVQHVKSPQQTMEYIRPLSQLVHQHFPRVAFWTDLEIFRKYPLPRVPAPWTRVLEQLELESAVVDAITQWEFWSYMDPRNPTASKDLYADYKAWYLAHKKPN